MRLVHVPLALAIIVSCLPAAEPKDVKFYNVEKEYRRTVTYVYRVKQAETLELKQILAGMLSIYGSLYVNEQNRELYITDVEEKIADLKAVLGRLDGPDLKAGNNLVSKRILLKHERVSEVSGIVRHKLSPDGSLVEVPNLNALVVTDIPSKIEEVERLLVTVDTTAAHVAIEITIVEFDATRFSSLGINLFSWLQGLSITTDLEANDLADALKNIHKRGRMTVMPERNRETGQQTGLVGDGQGFRLTGRFSVSDLVGFICENGDGTVLAGTRVVTRNNKSATIRAVEVIPFGVEAGVGAPTDVLSNPVIGGTSVSVIPTVQEDSLINLRVNSSIVSLTGWSPNGRPIVFDRGLNTEVKVKDNSVLVLGGLKKRETIEVRKGIPGLKEIPIIQYLFSVKRTEIREREVLIFVRPTTRISTAISEGELDRVMQMYREVQEKGLSRTKRRRRKAAAAAGAGVAQQEE